MTYLKYYKSPLGDILLTADKIGLTGARFKGDRYYDANFPDEYSETGTPVWLIILSEIV